MQTLESYLTKKGWKADFEETKKDFNSLYRTSSKGLTERIKNEQGNAALGTLFLTAGICMTYLGVKNFFGEDPKMFSTGAVELALAGINYVLAKVNF
ncbi:hypothetical protein FJZ53_05110 [Candidatus Woesearchaeota archaeon]|nr:hypothetical protein [Candidatus Woesearchaeota archaeon]